MEKLLIEQPDLCVHADPETGGITQITLYGTPLLSGADSAETEIAVNGLPLRTRSEGGALRAERWVNQYTGFGLEITRELRAEAAHRRLALAYHVRRHPAPATCPTPGPGGPPIEARLFVDSITVPRWQWQFWGEETRMLHLSLHNSGPDGDFGHVGYNRGPVAEVKQSMGNIWRRQYPGVMAIHGAVYYSEKTGHWLAFTCRRPAVGYYLELAGAGLGLSYSYTLHDEFKPGQALQLPNIHLHYGRTTAEMEQFVKDYTTQYWLPVPEWNDRITWFGFCVWDPHTSWTGIWDKAQRLLDAGVCNGIAGLFHHWSRAAGGTTPLGYEPDPTMGPVRDFERGALALKARGVPLGIWMSHSGLAEGREIDPDWFIRGVDDGWTASWGARGKPNLLCINPGHPGYIEYTKKWIKYYIELGFREFYFDCAGWAMPADYRPRRFMRFPGDVGLMSVRFYDEITAYAQSLDPGVIVCCESMPSDFCMHLGSISTNPVHSPDGLGPRDYVLSWNQLPGRRVAVDSGGCLVPASGFCLLPGEDSVPLPFEERFDRIAGNALFRAVKELVAERGCSAARHLPGDFSLFSDRLVCPWHYKGQPLRLPPEHAGVTQLTDVLSGATLHRDADSTFVAPAGPGLYAFTKQGTP
jgi:hypothetical protein